MVGPHAGGLEGALDARNGGEFIRGDGELAFATVLDAGLPEREEVGSVCWVEGGAGGEDGGAFCKARC